MNNQKMMKALKYRFRSVFIDFPDSNKELFHNLKHCIFLFDPEWVQNLKPSSEKNIQKLEQMVEQDFGKKLPPCYKLYLQEMGANDGELLLQHITNLDYYLWDYDIEEFLRHFDKGDMAESPQKCMTKLRNKDFVDKRMLSFLWYLFPEELSVSIGFAFTLNEKNFDEIVMSSESRVICYDTFPKQLAYCQYLKAIHWMENHSEKMKHKKWNSFVSSTSDSIFSARFRAYCPTEWTGEDGQTNYTLYVTFLEKLETRFYLEEAWFSRQKVFPENEISCSDDDYTFFSRYIAFSSMSDLTLFIELHPNPFICKPFIQVHLLGKDVAEMNEIMYAILEHTTLLEAEKDESRLFAKMELE